MSVFNNLKVRNKLLVFISAMLFALAVSGWVGYRGFDEWSSNMQVMSDNRLPGVIALGHLNTERMAIRAQTISVLQYADNVTAYDALNRIYEERKSSWGVIDKYWGLMGAIPKLTAEERQAWETLQNHYQAWRNIYVELDRLIVELAKSRQRDVYNQLFADYRIKVAQMVPISDAMGANFERLEALSVTQAEQLAGFAVIHAAKNSNLLSWTLGVAFVLSILLGLLIIRSISRPLNVMKQTLQNIDQMGDYSKTVDYKATDEVGEAALALNNMTSNLQAALANTNQVMAAIASGDFSKRIEGSYCGDLDNLKTNVNTSADNIARVMQSFGEVMQSMREGQFDIKINTNAEGEYKTILNNTAVAMQTLNQVMAEIAEVMELQTQGDLTRQVLVDCQGQLLGLKDSINQNAENLSRIISEAMQGADIVSTAADEVAKGAIDLSQRVQEQASALEESAATMEEFGVAIQNNAKNAHDETELEHQVEEKAKQAADVMHQTIGAMNSIQESSHKISEIVTLIDGIAFQTNLLALNAAVEAARAGDHGRGFAVVAGEVRALAQKSAEAAKDIKNLIDESVERISQGTKLASESGVVINEIKEAIEEVTKMSESISRSSAEQADGVTQLQTAIAQIDEATQQNAALVEQTSVAADSMKEEAAKLSKNMAFFKTGKALQSPHVMTTAESHQLSGPVISLLKKKADMKPRAPALKAVVNGAGENVWDSF